MRPKGEKVSMVMKTLMLTNDDGCLTDAIDSETTIDFVLIASSL